MGLIDISSAPCKNEKSVVWANDGILIAFVDMSPTEESEIEEGEIETGQSGVSCRLFSLTF